MKWEGSSRQEKIEIYDRMMERLLNLREQGISQAKLAELHMDFMERLSLNEMLDVLERNVYKKVYHLFFNDWSVLDYRTGHRNPTVAEMAINELAGKLDEAETIALKNLAGSFAAPYRILSFREGWGRLENIILPKANFEVQTQFRDLMPGDIVVTRLLPLEKDWLLLEPWLLLLPNNEKAFVEELRRTIKNEGYRRRDANQFCKDQTLIFLQVINRTIIEIEKEVIGMIENLPFRPEWQEAVLPNPDRIKEYLKQNQAFTDMQPGNPERFLFINRSGRGKLTWGYVIVEEDNILLCVPPREDPKVVINALEEAIADSISENETLAFSRVGCSSERTEHYNQLVINDFSEFLKTHDNMTEFILMPSRCPDNTNVEQSRADFFAKLSLKLGERMKN